ncbi:hypothetical protein P691DRAFT_544140 [Macrolepiota fuliginosa MF-IS2]|uniref:Uncharacterized protein n=1 Tax=Macrolepiota fuliginosa MF-IS2 TaxID=1400762 RepID=A0A9P5X176_9AGAR|nr:hypothetical protein P691DRAFT_544140 [Macrolepiota fuliginosa MF-IS2]
MVRLRNPDEKGLIDSLAPDIQHGFDNFINLWNYVLSTYNSLQTTYLRQHPNETFPALDKVQGFIEQETIDHRIKSPHHFVNQCHTSNIHSYPLCLPTTYITPS